jgi:CO/xanthine dehydrogenase Mo-binding subunit
MTHRALPVVRLDGREKVTGQAGYTGDLKLPGMLHGKVLRSPVPHARIRRIDVRGADAAQGVVAVLSRDTLQAVSPFMGVQIRDHPIVALEKVRYSGDIVAAVAATEEALAEDALRKIVVDYENLPAVYEIEDAIDPAAPLVHETIDRVKHLEYGRGATSVLHEHSNICHHFRYERGDVARALLEADEVFEDTFSFPAAHHAPLEPHISVAQVEGEHLTVWSATQTPFPLRHELCRIFGLSYNRVRVLVPYVGGSFGGQKSRITAILATALSRMTSRPVRLAFSAEEGFQTITQGRMKISMATGVKRDGTFVARRCTVHLNCGAYASNSPSIVEKAGYRAHGPYRLPHVLTDAYGVYTNRVPAGSFRGFGAPALSFAYESHLDMIAHRMQLDPVALRMKNLLDPGEAYAPGDTPMDCDLKGALQKLVIAVGGSAPVAAPDGSTKRRGVGVACCLKDGGGTNKSAHAMVKILSDGSVLLFSGAVEIGQGVRTALAQIVARELALPPEDVQVADVDTHSTPFDTGTHSSSSTSIMGQAVQRAAADAAGQLRAAAARLCGISASEVELRDGGILARDTTLTFQEVLLRSRAETRGEIIGNGLFQASRDPGVPLGFPSPFWEMGLGAAEIEVDPETGVVRILRYFSITDAGRMIEPLRCRAQDEGAVLFGVGLALSEELVFDQGRLLNGNLAEYRLARFLDLPQALSTDIVESRGGPGPYGAKGIGEAALLPVAPAVCNALFHATGTRVREVPMTPERVWRALRRD